MKSDLSLSIEGTYDPEFAPLIEEFARGIGGGVDTGAALAVSWNGRRVVDVWGGYRDQGESAPWYADTLAPVMSIGKAMIATVLLALAETGQLDLDAPIAEIWPEFAQQGKETITSVHVLTHTAGLPFHTAVSDGADWTKHEVLADSLEQQAPRWAPGSTPAYHSLTMGTLVDAIVRRVTGQDVSSWFASTIANPRGIDASLGLPDGLRGRRAEVGTSAQPEVVIEDGCAADPSCRPDPNEPVRTNTLLNDRRFETSEWPSINCFATARGLSDFYGAILGDGLDVGPLLSADQLRRATTEHWAACEASGGQFKRMGLGVNLGATPANWFGPDNHAFGHGGKGGSTAFGDTRRRVSVGYVTNSFYQYDGSGPRAQALSRALDSIIG
jgi:CubicO group peptidase (beta-lactamase class C family)